MRACVKASGLLALCASLAIVAASWGAAAQQEKVSARGTVTKVTPAADAAKDRGILVIVRIEGPRDKAVEHEKAVVKVTTKTKLEKMAGGKKVEAKVEDLKEGVKVESVFTGPVLESFPVQATAGSLLILEEAKK